ncbi:MAG: enoyl-CoA hydratase-related protein [Ignavibacteria bacterium]|jgi:methylglutaconyl-CoA hydratase
MIKFELQEGIGLLTLNRPDKRNALHPDLISQVKVELKKHWNDESLKSLMITGAGKTFCAGADLAYLKKLSNYTSAENEKDSAELAEMFKMIYHFPKPTIAAVNGAAIAGGCGLASACDLVIADEEHAKFGYSEVKIGFLPAMVSIFLIRRIGEGMARQLLLTGELLNSKRAFEIGFVNYLYNNALEGAREVASKLINNSNQSLMETKSMINKIFNLSVDEAVDYCVKLNAISRSSSDFKKGIESFLNK